LGTCTSNTTLPENAQGVITPSDVSSSSTLSSGYAKAFKAYWTTMGIWGTYNLFDAGLSQFLALDTLRHGTNPASYIHILFNGADPSHGGSITGSSIALARSLQENAKGYFYVFKDSAFLQSPECPNASDNPQSPIPLICNTALKIIFPRLHAIASGISSTGLPEDENVSVEKAAIGALSGLFTPTVKFRFTPEDAQCHTPSDPSIDPDTCIFEDDADYRGGIAYRTTHNLFLL